MIDCEDRGLAIGIWVGDYGFVGYRGWMGGEEFGDLVRRNRRG